MSKFNTSITEAMEALDAEIAEVEKELEQLRETRTHLEKVLVEDDGDTPKTKRKVVAGKGTHTIKVTDKRTTGRESTKRERITHMLEDGAKVSDIADELGVSPNYVYTVRKAEGMDTGRQGKRGRTTTGRSARASNGNGKTKRDQIREMLSDGMKVRDIAEELGITPSYVYNVKNA